MKQSLINVRLQEHRNFLNLAVPMIGAYISTPLLGVVDTAIMGRFPQAAYIGGVSVAVLIFNTLYWLLGFLRVSTSGFSAQACGLKAKQTITLSLLRPMIIACGLGMLIILCQQPIKTIMFALLAPNKTVGYLAGTYYNIRIWGAPFVLVNYVINGWLIGMAKVGLSLFLQVHMNLLNIILAAVLVVGLGMDVDGVATATLISEITTACIGGLIIRKTHIVSLNGISLPMLFDAKAFISMMKVNGDLFIRTACLLAVYNFFTAYSMRYGDVVLAANTVLMQIHFVMANLIGAIANTGTILVGQAIGEKNPELYLKTVKLTAFWGSITAGALSVTAVFFKEPLIRLFTNILEIQQACMDYIIWIVVFPPAAFWGLQLYGIFTGATETGPIRNSMLYSLLVFFIALWSVVPISGNHGIWFAFIIFSIGRSLFLWPYLQGLNKKVLCFKTKPEL